jgi:N-acetyl-1-D-myo-inositol-2-amino-2-deoxy-alpha-D-glucopyranoside deacetylase
VTPPARRRLLLVHAHPDDETLATGGTMARYAAEPDTSVTLVTCTLGEEGEVIPPELALLAADHADQLGGYRVGELAAACTALGVSDHRFLGGAGRWRDSGMVLAGQGVRAAAPAALHPRALAAREALADQVDALTAVLEEVAPQVVVTYAADGGYGHPDHVRAHEITVAAARRVPEVRRVYGAVVGRSALAAGLAALADVPGLPFRMPAPDELPSVPDGDVAVRVDVRGQRAARLAALRAHATQVALFVQDGTAALAMSNRVAQPLLDVEEFTLVSGAIDERHGRDDLFAGVEA